MKRAIVKKLSDACDQTLESEMQVVYVLVEIRKYLEQDPKLRNRHPALYFYCCWAIHSEATGNGADRIIERFDRLYPLMKGPLSRQQANTIFRTITLQKLRDELTAFLDAIGVQSSIKTSASDWLKFLRAYAAVTEDCPFVISTNTTVQLNHIDNILVQTVELPAGSPPETIFSTLWLIRKGKKTLGEYGTTFTDYSSSGTAANPPHSAPQTPALPAPQSRQ
jgi:hypothetical protein